MSLVNCEVCYSANIGGDFVKVIQKNFDVSLASFENILFDFLESCGFVVESEVSCNCFLTSYKYVEGDRMVSDYRVLERSPNFGVIDFLKKYAYFDTGLPPFCSVWQRAAYRYEICLEPVDPNKEIVIKVWADIIGWEQCFSWHSFKSKGMLERMLLKRLTSFAEKHKERF